MLYTGLTPLNRILNDLDRMCLCLITVVRMLNARLTTVYFFQQEKEAILARLDRTLIEQNTEINRMCLLRNQMARDVDSLKRLFHDFEKREGRYVSTFVPLHVSLGKGVAPSTVGSSTMVLSTPATSTTPQPFQTAKSMKFVKDGTGQYPCPVCNKHAPSLPTIRSHFRSHTGEKLICQHCGKGVKHEKALRKHELSHFNQDPFKCDICGKEHESVHNLNTHRASHAQTAMYSCPIQNCPLKAIRQKSSFNRHLEGVHKISRKHAHLYTLTVNEVEYETTQQWEERTGLRANLPQREDL